MKYKYGNDDIITGYIKQLLQSFNLPRYNCYIEGKPIYEGQYYIKGDKLVKCVNLENNLTLLEVDNYKFGLKLINASTNFIINSTNYDTYTHSYLGEYLRFIRDLKNLNLMPLYNCLIDEKAKNLNYTVNNGTIVVNTDDEKYNYFMAKVRFDLDYTIGIESLVQYEMFCVLYTDDEVLDVSKVLTQNSYKRINSSTYRNPFIYSTNINSASYSKKQLNQLLNSERNLMLIIKLPKMVNTSVSVLEGYYVQCSNTCGGLYVPVVLDNGFDPIATKLSLLSINTTTSYPFADRLAEYLLHNVIDQTEFIANNVKMVLNKIYQDYPFKIAYGIWSPDMNLKVRYFTDKFKSSKDTVTIKNGNTIVRDKIKYYDKFADTLNYADKDIESLLEAN